MKYVYKVAWLLIMVAVWRIVEDEMFAENKPKSK